MPQDKYVTVRFDELMYETQKAYLVNIDDEEVWIPKSVIEDFDEKNGQMIIAEWFASKEGLD